MGFSEAIMHVFQNYANFNGRARRSEYWFFALFNALMSLVTLWIPFAGLIYSLLVLIPNLALSVRRLHDIGKTGFYLLLSLIPLVGWVILLIWSLQDSDPGSNIYGPNPKLGDYGYASPMGGQTLPVNYATPGNQLQHFAQNDGQPMRQWQLQGAKGDFAGHKIDIRGRMIVGRDSSCDIRFSAGTPGISRRHFEINSQNGGLFIRDLGSSYGTYINHDQRLKPDQPVQVKSGDYIFVGTQKQMFVVSRSA